VVRKLSIFASLAAAAVIFVGCGGGGGGGGYIPPDPGPGPGPGPGPVLETLYLDTVGGGVVNIYYSCSSGDGWTDGEGGFQFVTGDICTFDFIGLGGSWIDPLYIDYADGSGVSDIYYECFFAGVGYTDFNGEFIYDVDDTCDFYF